MSRVSDDLILLDVSSASKSLSSVNSSPTEETDLNPVKYASLINSIISSFSKLPFLFFTICPTISIEAKAWV